MTVKELIEKLEKIEDKDADVIISISAVQPDWLKLMPVENRNRNFLVIGTK